MADNNSDPTFFDKIKGLPEMAINQTKHDYAQTIQNKADREAILARETNSNALTSSQKEQLSYISNAEDAQKFVDASILGNENGDYTAGQSVYKESLKSFGKAWGDVAVNAAELYVGGALAKGVFKGGSKLFNSMFKSAKQTERIEPTMGKAFESEYRAAQRAKKAEESIARNQENGGYWKNKQGKGSSTFNTNTQRATNAEKSAAEKKAAEDTSWENARPDQSRNPFNKTPPKIEPTPIEPSQPSWLSKIGKSIGKTALKGVAGYTAILGGAKGISMLAGNHLDKRRKEQLPSDFEGSEFDVKSKYPENPDNSPSYEDPADTESSEVGDLLTGLGGAAVGAYVGSGYKNPFKGIGGIVSGVGSLFPSGNSAEATLSSMPSGGDSGIVGQGSFNEGDTGGKTVLEVLNKIYSVLSSTKNITEGISRNVEILVRGQSQQDAARDLSSENIRARQNEGGTASPIFGGGEGESSINESSKEKEESGGKFFDALKQIGGIVAKTASKYKFPILAATGIGASMFFGNKAEANVNKDETAKAFRQGSSSNPVNISGNDDELVKTIALIESGGKVGAKPTTSSAQGLWQFTAGTWKDTVKAMGKHYTLADRNDPQKAEEVMRFFTARNKQIFAQKTGRLPTNKELYMSHFLGSEGASRFANANPNSSAASILPSAASANYNIFYDKKTGRKRTVQEVTNIMGGRYDEGKSALTSGKWGKYGIPDTIRNIGTNDGNITTNTEIVKRDNNSTELPASPNHFETSPGNNLEVKPLVKDITGEKPVAESQKDYEKTKKETSFLYKNKNANGALFPVNAKQTPLNSGGLMTVDSRIPEVSDNNASIMQAVSNLTKVSKNIMQANAPQQQQQPTIQHQPSSSRAGTSRPTPRVRNDDPTLMMIERGNLWNTNTHEA